MRFTSGGTHAAFVVRCLLLCAVSEAAAAQTASEQVAPAQVANGALVSPRRPVPVGKAPGLQFRQIKTSPEEQVYAVVLRNGDEALSGLTDFAIQHNIADAHFTAIGACSRATLAWLDLSLKQYHAIVVPDQHEVLSLVGDIAMFNGKPVIHMHATLGGPRGDTVGGHVFELMVNPTLEVFLTVLTTPLQKKPDAASGMVLIEPVP